MTMLTDINERKTLLRQIIPKLEVVRAPRSSGQLPGLSWNDYFANNPEHAELLGYNNKDKDTSLWNANNVVGRWLMNKEGIKPGKASNGTSRTKGNSLSLQDRKAVIKEIINDVPLTSARRGKGAQRDFRTYFDGHPEQAALLGYGTNPRLWARNLRLTEKIDPRKNKALVPYTVDTQAIAQDVAELEQKAEVVRQVQLEAEVKHLKGQLKANEVILNQLRTEMDEARSITFELLIQLRRAKA